MGGSQGIKIARDSITYCTSGLVDRNKGSTLSYLHKAIKALNQLLNYAATHPNIIVRYLASDMMLSIHSDASYLSEAEARSRVGGYFYLDNLPNNPQLHRLNGNVLIISNIMRQVLASATEAEAAALFYNAQEACPLRV